MLNLLIRKIGRIQSKLIERKNPKRELTSSFTSIVLRCRGRVEIDLPWSMVTHIVAFKKDEITSDLICFELHFKQNDRDGLVEITEDMKGFTCAVETMERVLTGFDKQWWSKVAKPAFSSNLTEIYRKPTKAS